MSTEVEDRPARRRSGGRSGNARRGSTIAIKQSPWELTVNTDHPTTPLRPDGVEAIHNAAMTVLEEIGIEFLQEPVTRAVAGRTAFIAHGDGLGAGDLGYKVLQAGLRSIVTRTAFGLLPIPVGDRIARGVSHTEERWDQWGERQVSRSDALRDWAVAKLEAEAELDLVLLGHTHLPLVREHEHGRWYVNSGDWVFHQSYVILTEGESPRLLDWRER